MMWVQHFILVCHQTNTYSLRSKQKTAFMSKQVDVTIKFLTPEVPRTASLSLCSSLCISFFFNFSTFFFNKPFLLSLYTYASIRIYLISLLIRKQYNIVGNTYHIQIVYFKYEELKNCSSLHLPGANIDAGWLIMITFRMYGGV